MRHAKLILAAFFAIQFASDLDCGFQLGSFCSATPVRVESDEIHDQIIELINKLRFSQATKLIDEKLLQNPRDYKTHLLRKALANALIRRKKRKEAEQQFEKILDYVFQNPVESQPLLKHVVQILVNLRYVQQHIEPKATETLDKAIHAFKIAATENPGNAAYSNGLSATVVFKTRGLAQQGNWPVALTVFEREITRLRRRWQQDCGNPDHWLRLVYMLESATRTIGDASQGSSGMWSLEKSNLLRAGIERFPQSTQLVKQYFSEELEQVKRYGAVDVELAVGMLDSVIVELQNIFDQIEITKPLLPTKIGLEKHSQFLRRSLARIQLVGNKLPELGEIDWTNEEGFNLEKHVKQIAIVYFFSQSSEKSVAELIKLNDVVSNRFPAVQLIGLTHGISGSFTKIRPVVTKGLASDKQRLAYRQKVEQNIVEANHFTFPVGFLENPFETAQTVGILELPFAILVNEDGICQSVHTGELILQSITGEIDANPSPINK